MTHLIPVHFDTDPLQVLSDLDYVFHRVADPSDSATLVSRIVLKKRPDPVILCKIIGTNKTKYMYRYKIRLFYNVHLLVTK